jgi:hypothetical protein
MADITNPQFVKFANEKCRPLADAAEQVYQTAKRFQAEWAAISADNIPNTADNIADGSDVDGRKRFTGAAAQALKSLADAQVVWFETNATIGGITKTRIAWIQTFSVNGQARY